MTLQQRYEEKKMTLDELRTHQDNNTAVVLEYRV